MEYVNGGDFGTYLVNNSKSLLFTLYNHLKRDPSKRADQVFYCRNDQYIGIYAYIWNSS